MISKIQDPSVNPKGQDPRGEIRNPKSKIRVDPQDRQVVRSWDRQIVGSGDRESVESMESVERLISSSPTGQLAALAPSQRRGAPASLYDQLLKGELAVSIFSPKSRFCHTLALKK
jgi:hypothetical protein